MAYDLEEQEQLDELKVWWKTYGKMVSAAVLALLVAYAAYQGWNLYQGKQAVARQLLADIYGWFTEGFDTADLREAKALLDALA